LNKDFSVLMPVYFGDRPLWLDQALESLHHQSVRAKQIVLIQDGNISADLIKIISKYKQIMPIDHFVLEKNLGLSSALNKGLELCNYNLVARVDSDDINLIDRFKIQLNELERNDKISVIGSWVTEFEGDKNNQIGIRKVPLDNKHIIKYSKIRSPLNHPSVLFKKNDILSVGGYNEALINRQDHDLWVRLLINGYKITNIPQSLVLVRISNEFYLRRGGFKQFMVDYNLTKSFFNNNFINRVEYYFILFLKLIFRLTPTSIIRIYYRLFFRKI
tara:strand:+ start:2279 stop:3100 length:822 start_codon:yes stop_codon:yes gene_type:complete